MRQITHLFATDEYADVPAYLLLFVDHAETDARILAFEIGK